MNIQNKRNMINSPLKFIFLESSLDGKTKSKSTTQLILLNTFSINVYKCENIDNFINFDWVREIFLGAKMANHLECVDLFALSAKLYLSKKIARCASNRAGHGLKDSN